MSQLPKNPSLGMQPLPNEVSGDDKEWNPDDDAEFDRDNNQFAGNTYEERASNPIYANNSMS